MTQALSQITPNPLLSPSPSLKLCALNNSNHKKRLFVRKPGLNYLILPVEKHRKNLGEHIDTSLTQTQSYLQDKSEQKKTTEDSKTIRMQRHTQNFKKQQLHQTSFISSKEVNWSPKNSTVDLLLGLKYIQRTPEHNNRQNGAFKAQKPVICFSGFETHTSDNSLRKVSGNPKTVKTLPQTEDKFYCDPAHQLKNLIKGASQNDLGVKQDILVCAQCKKLRRKNQLLNDKCAKLQQQLQLRSQDVRILSQKVQALKELKQMSKSQEIKLREEMYLKEIQIYKDCSSRYENVRKQLSRVVQRVKYLEIENGVLSRYKQDCCQAQREYEKIKQQNDNLKRQIHSISRIGQKYNNKKPSNEAGRKQFEGRRIPQFKLTKQEDTISLELSEASYEYS